MIETGPGNPGTSVLRYQLILLLLFPVLVCYTLWQGLRHRDLQYIVQRLGFAYGRCPAKAVWIHCASVGEVQAGIALIQAIREEHPHLKLVISTTTPTGARIARQKLADHAHCISLAIDWPFAVKRLIGAIKPQCLLVMETELWPNLYRLCAQRCPIVIVNARLSARTTNTSAWIRNLYAATLANTSAILSRSTQDSELYLAMGARSEQINTLGNIKFSIKPPAQPSPHPLQGKPYVLAASTHNDEELQIARAWHQSGDSQLQLVIAPRHPIRKEAIIKQLQAASIPYVLRSRGQLPDNSTQVYLADTLGELMMFFEHAQLVFMGGTLVPVGGHNILEPAVLGKPIVFGPHMQNFAFEAQQFLQQHAALQVASAEELVTQIKRLTAAPEQLAALGQQAKTIMDKHQDIINRYLLSLEPFLSRNSGA